MWTDIVQMSELHLSFLLILLNPTWKFAYCIEKLASFQGLPVCIYSNTCLGKFLASLPRPCIIVYAKGREERGKPKNEATEKHVLHFPNPFSVPFW